MTALPSRRRRSTLIATAAAVAAVIAAVALATLGGVTLYHSTEGADAASGVPELVFPSTPTGVVAAVDESGALASLAVVVVQPSGAGGSVVTVPVSADSTNGKGEDRLPIAETMALRGPESLEPELESMLALGIDAVEVVDAGALAAALEGIGSFEVDLPADVTAAGGDVVAEAGRATLDPASAAAILTARDPAVPALDQYPTATAVWSGIAAAMSGDDTAVADGAAVQGMLAALAGGPVGARGLRAETPDAEQNPRGVDASLLDQADVTLVFAQVAPGKVAAPNPAITLRLEVQFSDEQLDGTGMTNDEVAYAAISTLLFVGANVLSVNTEPGTAGEVTVVEIADETLADATDGIDLLFGEIDVQPAETRIVGVDADPATRHELPRTARRLGWHPPTRPRPTIPGPLMDERPDDALTVATVAARAADEKQGRNIVVLDVGEILAIAELFVVLEAPNRRLVRTLVDEIEQAVRAATGRSPRRVEGVREQQWVLLDYGDVIVHVFLDEVRRFYEIERLYRDAPMVEWAS